MYPRITGVEEEGDIKAATDGWRELSKVFGEFKVELLHGRMNWRRKER